MKGQVFIIIAILVILAVTLIRTQTGLSRVGELTTSQIFSFLPDDFDNIKGEYEKAVRISLARENYPSALQRNLNNFTNFSVRSLSARNSTLRVVYSFVYFNSSFFNVTLGNFLGGNITNITINQSTSAEGFTQDFMPSGLSNSSGFALSAGDLNVTVRYIFNNASRNFSYASTTSKRATAFFDIFFQEEGSFLSDNLIINLTT